MFLDEAVKRAYGGVLCVLREKLPRQVFARLAGFASTSVSGFRPIDDLVHHASDAEARLSLSWFRRPFMLAACRGSVLAVDPYDWDGADSLAFALLGFGFGFSFGLEPSSCCLVDSLVGLGVDLVLDVVEGVLEEREEYLLYWTVVGDLFQDLGGWVGF